MTTPLTSGTDCTRKAFVARFRPVARMAPDALGTHQTDGLSLNGARKEQAKAIFTKGHADF
ncbi:hypothetical protein D3C84_1305340 [compost metagenome]